MEDADQVQLPGFRPHESIELLLGVHPKAHRTLCCVVYRQHCLDPVIFSGQQATGLKGSLLRHVKTHLLPMDGFHDQDVFHLANQCCNPAYQSQGDQRLDHRAPQWDAVQQVTGQCRQGIKRPKQRQPKLDR